MKKVLVFLLLFFSMFIFLSCSSNTEDIKDTSDESSTVAENTSTDTHDKLVAYFSYTGNTKRVAEYISKEIDGELFEIEPKEPYTEEDTDYNNQNSRSKVETADETARPEIVGKVDDMDKYNYVFLGYPIWNGEAPRVIDTFLDSYDFSGKIIIPFCTSTSSGIGNSATNLEGLAPGADWEQGIRFASDVDDQTIQDWLDSLDLNNK